MKIKLQQESWPQYNYVMSCCKNNVDNQNVSDMCTLYY
jgi:hypothetical protein